MSSRKTAPATFCRPVRTAFVPVGLQGYPEHIGATMRTNLTLGEYEALSTDWRGTLRRIVVDWTLVDHEGQPVPLDDTLGRATNEELLGLLNSYLEILQARTSLGKESDAPSTTTTSTSS